MVVFSELFSLFVKISICDALLSRNLFNNMMHAKWMCYALLKELENLKLSSSTRSATADKFITRKHKEAVSNVEITVAK